MPGSLHELWSVIEQVLLEHQHGTRGADCNDVQADDYADPQMHLEQNLAPR
jgi:hypothetical protein